MNSDKLTMNELSINLKSLFIDQNLSTKEFNERVKKIEENYESISQDHEEKYRRNNRFFNKFFGEIKPLQLLANHLSCSSILITNDNSIQSAEIDAVLYLSEEKQHIECTLAFDGEEHALIMEHLEKFGRAPFYNKIKTNGKTKASKAREIHETLSISIGPKEKEELKNKLIKLLNEQIEKKEKKDNLAYKNAWLLIAFFRRDYFMFTNEELIEILTQVPIKSLTIFKKIYFVGYEGDEWGGIIYSRNA